MSHANARVMALLLQVNSVADINDCIYEGQFDFDEEYVGQSEEKLERMKEEAEDKPGCELLWEKASVIIAARKRHRRIFAEKKEVRFGNG